MTLRKIGIAITSLLGLAALAGCSDSDGQGTVRFTTWGEAYIEQQIPSDPTGEGGFVDGWTLKYDKFLVVFHNITVADSGSNLGAQMPGSTMVDNVVPGRKELFTFESLDAKHWDRVGYQIKPAVGDTLALQGSLTDRDMMAKNGYSVYVSGSATKTGADGAVTTKTFHWGFQTATQYSNCLQPAESGAPIEGLVVTNGGTDTSELTTHGDHFFYDRLMSSPDPAIRTSLRFEEKAAADANNDGEITLEELDAVMIDVRKYDPSGLSARTLGSFVGSLVRTVGHYRGEGECTVSAIP